jgi:UDP-N-acetyl-D-mannosaminuronic acid transferase (WecB/TagA/CpsF family)
LRDLPLDALTMEQALDRVDEAIARRSRLRVGVVNAAKIVRMTRDPVLSEDVLSSDLILADGASVWASRLLGGRFPSEWRASTSCWDPPERSAALAPGVLPGGDRGGADGRLLTHAS